MQFHSAYAEPIKDEYLVKFKDGPSESIPMDSIAAEIGGAKIQIVVPSQNIALVKPSTSNLSNRDVLDKLRKRTDVELVQPNFRYKTTLFIPHEKLTLARNEANKPDPQTPPTQAPGKDPMVDQDKDLKLANVIKAWDIERGNKEIVVAVIDTGVDYNHEDLITNIWHDPSDPKIVGWDFVDNDAMPFDVTAAINLFSGGGNPGHGTHCAGNVGATGDNALGISGVAQKVSIMALRMLDQEGQGDTAAGIKSIDWAVDHGAKIISASWGSEGSSEGDDLLEASIKRAGDKSVLFVAAAGNTEPSKQNEADNDNNPKRRAFPASFDLPNIISVAASSQKGTLANFTHFGAKSVHLAAPGEISFSTIPSNRSTKDYPGSTGYEDSFQIPILGKAPWNGTSMAAPQVAGAAALLLAKHPKWTHTELKKRLLETVRPEESLKDKTVTGGVLDVANALKE